MSYQPKYKFGQTIETSIETSNGYQYYVICTYNKVYKYSSSYEFRSLYDNSDADHVLYLLGNTCGKFCSWLREDELKGVYCFNQERGKKILEDYISAIISTIEIKSGVQEFLKLLFNGEFDKEEQNAIST